MTRQSGVDGWVGAMTCLMIRSHEKKLVSIVGFIRLYGEVAASYVQCGAHRIHIQAVGASRELYKQGIVQAGNCASRECCAS